MRKIKFRAWDSVHKQFDETVAANLLMQLHDPDEDVDEEYGTRFHLMQYTGSSDRNGKEIYEGDLIKHGHTRDRDYTQVSVVHYADDKAMFYLTHPNHTQFNVGAITKNVITGKNKIFEVIGNIYETPEMI